MRDLTADERAIVAGGYLSDYEDDSWYSQRFALRDYYYGGGLRYYVDANGLETVVVNASRDEPSPYGMQFFWSPSGASSGSGGGGGGGETDNTPDVRDVTCIELKPTVADLKAMHQLAVNVAALAKGWDSKYESMGFEPPEYGVLMYTLPGDSTVYVSSRAEGEVNRIPNEEWREVLEKMPAGAVIVGVWHSHPGSELPSGYRDSAGGGDWQFMTNLWNGTIGDWPYILRVDDNALMYITNSEGKTYVFDKSDYNRDGGVASGSKACAVNRGG